jgi:cellobiose phosphorylase
MFEQGIVLGFYQERSAAVSALKELRRRWHRRSAAIYCAQDGRIYIDKYEIPPSVGALLGGLTGILVGLFVAWILLPILLQQAVQEPSWVLLLFTLCGAFVGAVLARLLQWRISSAILACYKRWVVRNETLIIVQAHPRDMERVLGILRQTPGSVPITFAFHPANFLAAKSEEELLRRGPLPVERLSQEAGRLAASIHPVSPKAIRGKSLWQRLRRAEQTLRKIHDVLADMSRIGQAVTISAEWLLDNTYVIQGHIDDFRRLLPRRYYYELPIIARGPQAGYPRVYGIATELIADTDARLDRDYITSFLQAYQSITPLTMGELWAVPIMLRLRLIECVRCIALRVVKRECEREQADFLANRLLTAARRDPEQLHVFIAELVREIPDPSPHLVEQLVGYLYDEEAALSPVRGWLERKMGIPLPEAIQQEHREQTAEQITLANAITSLRFLSQLDWLPLFEAVSPVDEILRNDPAGIYARMDVSTRDRYRHEIEAISRRSKATEIEVAQRTQELAAQAEGELKRHVGYYLLDQGREVLEKSVGYSPALIERGRRWAKRYATPVYLGSIALLTMGFVVGLLMASAKAGATPMLLVLLGILALLPASELALQIVNFLVTRLITPYPLPRMSFKEGIPDEYRTLVVVPMMLLTPDSIRDEVERLEIRYLANPDENLRFALLSDFADAPEKEMPDDGERLEVAIEGIERLNRQYGPGRFFLFHRSRVWSDCEGCWMGWERKRGKLEQLNRYLMGEGGPELDNLLRVGDAERLRGIRFVITLDSDTQLPRDTARRLVETLAHPLNRPKVAPTGDRVERGYTVIQPRVSTSLPSATATFFSRLFTDPTGTDPYMRAVSDVYQDLFGEGSYHGKGIYDLAAFHHVLTHRFPEAHLLSHDLLEGAHVRVGFASDIELHDLFPRDYIAYSHRQHRWIRGDWQIIDWLLPRVPTPQGKVPNPLSLINRWKIFDNLRRSLTPVASVALIVACCLFSPNASLFALFVAVVLFSPMLSQLMVRLTQRPKIDPMVWFEPATNLLRCLVFTALLPHQAGLSLDAIGRVWYRRLISHRRLLEWETAQEAHRRSRNRQGRFLRRMSWIPLGSLMLAWILAFHRPDAFLVALPYLLLWALSPGLVLLLHLSPERILAQEITGADRQMLRQIARQTWRFFDDFVGPQTHWLPPDNYQEFLRTELAPRTSPTNIGLWLTSLLAARDFGYVSTDIVIERARATLQTLEKLERFEGHLLNWYNIYTLEPLWPQYVSTVDSGNLLASLWVLEQGIEEMIESPLIGPEALDGVADTLSLLRRLTSEEGKRGLAPEKSLASLVSAPPNALEELVERIRAAVSLVGKLTEVLGENRSGNESRLYWAQQVEKQVRAWNETVSRYFSWVEILAVMPVERLRSFVPNPQEWKEQALAKIPSLRRIASADIPGLKELLELQSNNGEFVLPKSVQIWLDRLAEAVSRAQWLAGEKLAEAEAVLAQARRLDEEMNMRFLYDSERRLFVVGYDVNEHRPSTTYYDLLASEARIASFVAIARGEVPVEHWWSLGRPFGLAYLRRPLLSWGGTMFEYLMPLLFTRSYPNSLLDQACHTAVACQIAYARQRGIPWGISESAFSALDAHQIYQYRSFGVPGLGLKRGLENDLVVAPYASALALAVDPTAAVRNLRRLSRLARLGLRGGYGYYDAIDYTRQRGLSGERGVIVYTYMAHHQGMTLVSIDNALHNNIMQKRFHADPRVRATESLLYERIPIAPTLVSQYMREAPPPRLAAIEAAPQASRVDTPHTNTPRTHLLSNGTYSIMLTNAGGGYSRWRDVEITRWRSDTTCDPWGPFCYVRDLDTGAVWSTTYHPVRTAASQYTVTFTADKAEFRRRDAGIETLMEVVVSPEDNVEVRHITLINRSLRTRQMELTTYAEISLAPHNADRAHPSFNKLFIQTEALPDQGALLACRRPRSSQENRLWAFHVLATDAKLLVPLQYETDRARFVGRGRTPERPVALEGDLSHTVGMVLDPIFSLRGRVALEAGERIHFSIVTGAAETREVALRLIEKYRDLQATHRAFEMAWTHAQLELRHLRIQQEDAQRFQQLARYILYPAALLRSPEERLRRNVLGQSHLWAHGISGDLPLVVVTISDVDDIALVRQVLMAHTYWHAHGLQVDLVILNEKADGYEQSLQEQLRKLVEAYSQTTGLDRPGGVYLRVAAQIPEEEITLLLTAARVVLVAARGSLGQQLGAPRHTVPLPPPATFDTRIKEEPSPPLPFLELPYFNGLGGFTWDGKEYAIYLGPHDQTPMPWANVIANPTFGTLITESGAGFTWYGNSQSNRLTPWSNDPISDPPGDVIYIRDEDMGVVWTPTPLPIRELDAYRTRHSQGYTLVEHNSHAIEQELVTFVPLDEAGGAPVRIQRLRLINRSSRLRRLSIIFYVEWVLGTDREETQIHLISYWDAESQALFARNAYHPDFGGRVAFVASSLPVISYTADRTEFLGRNGTKAAPAALTRTGLSKRTGAALDPCAALQVAVELEPQRQTEVVFLLGQAADASEARLLIQRYRSPQAAERTLKTTCQWWDHFLSTIQVETPELAVNLLMNRWLLYQDLSCRVWARSAFYQSGGAYGFRDQLQDVMALVYAAPHIAREQILRAASRQFVEGDVQHWWHVPSGAGVRTRISDDLLWLPFVTAHYVRTTGDRDILEECIPFLEGRSLEEEEQEAYFVPVVSTEHATLLEHCRRAISRGMTAGPHGLPLIGGGDWNDGLNRVGVGGKGESVWLAWFLIHVLNDFAELLHLRGEEKGAEEYKQQAIQLAEVIEKQAWDDQWYRRAYFDDGTPIGSKQNEEAQIDSLPQSWSVISGAAEPARAESAMRAVEERLIRKDEQMVLLFTPPFDKTPRDPGYIKGYPPGVRENGGQYTHGSLWVPMAFARRGEGDKAVAILRMMNPVEHARSPEDVRRYKVEPYVVAADIYALENHVGQGGWTWYTGSAGWMYRIWLEEIFGFRLRGNELTIDPCIASDWPGFTLRYRYKSTLYQVVVENPEHVCRGVCYMEVDGSPLSGQTLTLQDDGEHHLVRVCLGHKA